MHELSVTENVLQISLKHASESGAKKVVSINLVIGQLSSFVDDSISFYWDILSKGTLCEGSVLNFTRIPALLNCQICGETYPIPEALIPCPACGSGNVTIVRGEEFQVDSIDIETE